MSRPRTGPALLAALLAAPLLALTAGPGLASTKGFVLTSDYTSGGLSVVDLDTRAVSSDVAQVSPDAVERWYDGLLYVVNRQGYDNVQVIDPAQGYATVRQFSVGNGSNPQDIAFASPTKAYVSRLGDPDLLIVNPATGAALGSIPLGSYADADGNPEAARMTTVGTLLFVALQRLANFLPTDTSLVVIVDMSADTLFDADPFTPGRQVIRLTGTNPTTAFAQVPDGAVPFPGLDLYLGCTGRYQQLDGGIEDIHVPGWAHGQPQLIASAGYAITEAALGGDVLDLAGYAPDRSFAVVGDASYNTSLVSWSAVSHSLLGTLYAPPGFSLADAALNDRGELYACNGSFTAPGLHVFRAGTGAHLAGPLDTGLPPVQIVFDQSSEQAGVPAAPSGSGLTLASPAPNPARSGVRLALTLPGAARLTVEVFDLSGRLLRRLADGPHPAGTTSLAWDLADGRGQRVAPGAYLVRARAGAESAVRKFVVIE